MICSYATTNFIAGPRALLVSFLAVCLLCLAPNVRAAPGHGLEEIPATPYWTKCRGGGPDYATPLSACLASTDIPITSFPGQYFQPFDVQVVPGYEPNPTVNWPGKWGCLATAVNPVTGEIGVHGLCDLFPWFVCPASGGWNGGGVSRYCVRNICPANQTRDPETGACKTPQKTPPNCSGGDAGGASPSTPWVGNPIHAASGYKSDILPVYDGGAVSGLAYRLTYLGGGASANAYRPQLAHGALRSSSHERRLAPAYDALPPDGPTVVAAARPDGRLIGFSRAGNTYLPDADLADRLHREVDASGATTGWRYVSAGGDQSERYAPDGRLLAIASRAGLPQTLSYDPSGRLSGITDAFGRTLGFSHTGERITGMTDPGGGHYAYAYDANANLVALTWPDGHTRQYHYEDTAYPNALTGITDELGVRYATYRYDAAGRAVAETLAGGVGAYGLAFGSNSTVVTDPLGTARTYAFQTLHGVARSSGVSQPGGAGCGAAAESMTYDANGNLASKTDFNGRKTVYAYDLARNLETSRSEGLDGSGAALPESRTVTTAWHPVWRLPVRTEEYAGASATGTPLRRTDTAYDERGNPTARTVTDPAAGATRTWRTAYTYSTTVPGLILQKTEDGPRTDVSDVTVTDYYADDAACPAADLGPGRDKGCRGQLRQLTNALGQSTRFTRYDAHGQVEEIVDANGLVTTLDYDARQRLRHRSVGSELTTYQYDAAGQLVRLVPPDGAAIAYTYDAAHRLIRIEDALGNRIAYTLDAAGNRTREDLSDPSGTLVKSLSRAYDALGRLQTLTGVGND